MKIILLLIALGFICWLALSIYFAVKRDARQDEIDKTLIESGLKILQRLDDTKVKLIEAKRVDHNQKQ